MKKVKAFAPAHISGFFQPIINKNDSRRTGSRGAGVCISHGVTALVKAKKKNEQKIRIHVNGRERNYRVTKKAVQLILKDKPLYVDIGITLGLPMNHGFGMSAASALSAALAMSSILDKDCSDAIQAAHQAEIFFHTGLGDVITSAIGGFEIRERPGIFPFGKIKKISCQIPLILGIFPEKMSTEHILTDSQKMERIRLLGNKYTNMVLQSPNIESILKYSYLFTKESGLAPKNISSVLKKININQQGSMCMLGHAVFCIGNQLELRSILSKKSDVIMTTVDNKGARIIEKSF